MLKTRKNKVLVILIALFVAAIVGMVIYYLVSGGSKKSEPAPQPVVHEVEKIIEVEKLVEVEKEITADIIEDGLRDMGVLLTGEYYFTEVVSYSSIKKLFKTEIKLPFTESSYLASYNGEITAGIDFAALTVTKDDEKKLITIHMPKPEIQNIDIDPNSFELHSEKSGVGNPISAEDFNNSLIELENTARDKAIERGLLQRAEENARTIIENFVGGLVDTGLYSIEFAD